MGGKAFESDAIATPRMPTKIYKEVLERAEEALRTLFQTVDHAIEGPEKSSHGDLDVLVLPYPDLPVPSVDVIAELLGAVKRTKWQGNGIAQFAIPWPEERNDHTAAASCESSSGCVEPPTQLDDNDKEVQKCIQLDLNQFPTLQDMKWQLFNTAHGDLCNILSNMVRSKGFTINTQAFYLRIPSVEKHNRRAARVFLSKDPDQVLRYFALDTTRFWHPFSTLDEMMVYIATSRFFRPERQRIENTKASLNWTDQKYLDSRPIFKYWIDSFLPAHKSDKPGRDAHLTREDILEDIYAFFGHHVRTTYLSQKREADIEVARLTLWPNVRAAIRNDSPDISDEIMTDTIKGLKRVTQYHIHTDEPSEIGYTSVHDAFKSEDYESVTTWCAANHCAVLAAYKNGELEKISTLPGPHQLPGEDEHGVRDVEVYTSEDDAVIKRMKLDEGATWPEILRVLGKRSKSQLQAHWKGSVAKGGLCSDG